MDLFTMIKERLSKIPSEAYYIFTLFFITRIILTFIGIFSRAYVTEGKYFNISLNQLLTIWGVWDTSWYLDIAQNWYTSQTNMLGQGSLSFFPLYPLLMRLLGIAIGDFYNAGLIISNVCLIITCFYLFNLVKLDNDREVALNSIKYLFLFPTAFILSGVFSESLFLMLVIMCFYYAKKQNWMLVGLLGLLVSLSRPLGVLTFIPILYEYIKLKGFKLQEVKPDIVYLGLFPLGLLIFSIYNYHLTGDFLAFYHAESTWGRSLTNPIQSLIMGFSDRFTDSLFLAIFTIIPLILITIFYKKIGFSYWIFGVFSICLPVLTGNLQSSPRYALVAFPLFIIFAKLSKDKQLDQYTMIILAFVQGFLMVLWTSGIGVLM